MTLEQLLNKLVEKGWKPRLLDACKDQGKRIHYHKGKLWFCYYDENYKQGLAFPEVDMTIRELVSKESGLWQFVCENKLYKYNFEGIYVNDEWAKNVYYEISQFDEECDIIDTNAMKGEAFIGIHEPEFWIIESALCDEDRLEQFLLNSIIIDD